MQLIKQKWVVIALLFAIALASCNTAKPAEPALDANAVYTSVAGTMFAQLNDHQTQTAQAVPSSTVTNTVPDTNTPLPVDTDTPLPTGTPFSINTPGEVVLPSTPGGLTWGETGVGCDDATYLSETEPRSGTKFSPGTNFTKTWTFQNSGTCTWINSYSFAYVTGERMGGGDVRVSMSVNYVAPGQTHSFTVDLDAPHGPGRHVGCWQMKNATGTQFGARVCVDIVVK